MTTVTRDTSLLKDALAKAQFAAVSGYTNLDEHPDAFNEGLPWGPSRTPGLAKSSPEYVIIVLDADGHATIFRGFVSFEHAQDELKEAQASLATPIAALPTDRAYVFSADGRLERTWKLKSGESQE